MPGDESPLVTRRRVPADSYRSPATTGRRRPDRCARYQGAVSRAGPAIVCSLVLSLLAAVAVLRNEHSNEFAKGSYVVSLGFQSTASCYLHGMATREDGKRRVVDVVAVEPGLTDASLLRLRYEELDSVADTLVLVARGGPDPVTGSQAPWVWASAGSPAPEGGDGAPAAMRGPQWQSLIADYSHKLAVVVVPGEVAGGRAPAPSGKPDAGAAPDSPRRRVSADRSGGWHGDDTYARRLLTAAGGEALESVGADRRTLLVLGRAHEIPRAGAIELLQSCAPAGAGMCLATATYALSFEFRKPKAFRHSPLVLEAGSLVDEGARRAEAAGPGGRAGPWSGLDLGSFRGAGLPCLTDAGWTCEHCTTDWSLLEPAAVSSLRSWLGAGRAKRSSAAGAYRAMYDAYCVGEDPLGASPVRGFDVQVTAVGLPRPVLEGHAHFAHLLPGRCEGGEGAERLWNLASPKDAQPPA